MSFTIYVRSAAELDVAEAQLWYEEQQMGLASKFHQELSTVLDRLAETPLIYPAVYRNIRRAVLHRFPFLVWYRVEGEPRRMNLPTIQQSYQTPSISHRKKWLLR